jgi:hypothetical protein
MVNMDFKNIIEEHNKIVPLRKILPFILGFSFLSILIMTSSIIKSYFPNKLFFELQLKGVIDSIYDKPNDRYYYINDNWFLIKGEFIDSISISDSISKSKDSYLLEIFDGTTKRLKFRDEVKSVFFEDVDDNFFQK